MHKQSFPLSEHAPSGRITIHPAIAGAFHDLIMDRNWRYLPQTVHDHEKPIATRARKRCELRLSIPASE
jgi:hypothetical protein